MHIHIEGIRVKQLFSHQDVLVPVYSILYKGSRACSTTLTVFATHFITIPSFIQANSKSDPGN